MIGALVGRAITGPMLWGAGIAIAGLLVFSGWQTLRLSWAQTEIATLTGQATQDQQSIASCVAANDDGARVIASLAARNAELVGQRERITAEAADARAQVAEIERDRERKLASIRRTLAELRSSSAPATVTWLDAPVPAEVSQHIKTQREAFARRWGA